MLRATADSISPALTAIFNDSLARSKVLDAWKISIVTPIPKSDDPSSPTNYRPISLLSLESKVLKRIIHKRISDFRYTNKLLANCQFGFRPRSRSASLSNTFLVSAPIQTQTSKLSLIQCQKSLQLGPTQYYPLCLFLNRHPWTPSSLVKRLPLRKETKSCTRWHYLQTDQCHLRCATRLNPRPFTFQHCDRLHLKAPSLYLILYALV